jgi:hypothetical protein
LVWPKALTVANARQANTGANRRICFIKLSLFMVVSRFNFSELGGHSRVRTPRHGSEGVGNKSLQEGYCN